MTETLALLGEKWVQDALKAALLVAVTCSYLGVFVVLKRIVFVGVALAEAASLGASLAFFGPVRALFERALLLLPVLAPLEHYKPLVFATLLMLACVAFFSRLGPERRVTREAVIGAVFAGAAGLTRLVLSQIPAQAQHSADILTGNILGVEPLELTELVVAGVLVGLVQLCFFKEFLLVSFDPEVAHTLGYRSSRWELLWYTSLGVMIAVSIHVAGTLLVFAYLVLPPVTALLLFRRLAGVLFSSVAFGVLATVAGVLLSVTFLDLPTSPTIAGCAAALCVLAWAFRRLSDLPRRAAKVR